MKSFTLKKLHVIMFFLCIAVSFSMQAQKPELITDATKALNEMLEKSPKLKPKQASAYGYAVFPKITKAGIGIGGAGGKGVVYQGGGITGMSKMSQASIGLQLGGEQYSELILFHTKEAYDNFVNGKVKFDAQATAVAITAGASVDVPYQDGVLVYTMTKGGLMYQASIGGQKFKFEGK